MPNIFLIINVKNILRTELQETYEILDTSFYDTGIYGTSNNNWQYNSSYLTKTVETDGTGTLVENTTTGTTYRPYQVDLQSDSNPFDFDVPFAMEFDVVSLTNNILIIMISNDNQDGSVSFSYAGFTAGSTCKIEYSNGVFKFYKDGVPSATDRSFTLTGKVRLGFSLKNDCSIKYKNFKVYPI